MKKLLIIVGLLAFTSVLNLSCSTSIEDKCKDMGCLNGGTCNDGKCNCPSGYEGTYCQTPVSTSNPDLFIGTWVGTYRVLTSGASDSLFRDDTLIIKKGSTNKTILVEGNTRESTPVDDYVVCDIKEFKPKFYIEANLATFRVKGNKLTLDRKVGIGEINGAPFSGGITGQWTKK